MREARAGALLFAALLGGAWACAPKLQSPLPDGAAGAGTETGRQGGAGGAAGDGGTLGTGGSGVGGSPGDAGVDPSVCANLRQAYSAALGIAQECTVGAADQCAIPVKASFYCDCGTFANRDADMLTAIVNQFQAVGCQQSCNGYCIPRQTLTCQADATSGTGGRCLVPALLSLTAANDGGSFNVPVGSEIDVLLENASSNGYTNDVLLSSGAATVLEVTIPAGPMPSGGSTHLYRLRAASAGRVTVQIPYVAAASEAAHPAYTVTLDVESAAADASAAP